MKRQKLLQFQQVGMALEWTWFFSAGNGRTLARCSETHPRLATAMNGARHVVGGVLMQHKDTGEWFVMGRPDVKVQVLR